MFKIFFILLLSLPIISCSGIAIPPALKVAGYIKSAVDVTQMAGDNPTSTDIVVSNIKKEKCKTTNIIKGKEYCNSFKLS